MTPLTNGRARGRLTSLSCLGAVMLLCCGSLVPALAADDDKDNGKKGETAFDEIETQDIFGFTEGSGVGLQGEKEFSAETVAHFGKRDGRYAATETKLGMEYTPSQFVQVEFGGLLSAHAIKDVTDLDDRSSFDFMGAFAEFRYLLLERTSSSPFSVTLSAEPTWRRIDETSGERVTNFELETKVNADLEIVPNRAYAGFNVLYDPEWTRTALGEVERESTFGVSGALAFRPTPPLLIGMDLWYLRHYDGNGFEAFTGDAVFFGPTVYYQISDKSAISGAWETQIAGHAVGDPASLNLVDFPRHRAKLKLAIEF